MSSLVFDAANGQYSVYSCHCGCDGAVEVTPLMQEESVARYWYIRGHQPIGTAYEHIGRRFEFDASSALAPNSEVFVSDPTRPTDIVKSQSSSELEAFEALSEFDKDATTPVVRYKPDFFIDAPYSDWPSDEE